VVLGHERREHSQWRRLAFLTDALVKVHGGKNSSPDRYTKEWDELWMLPDEQAEISKQKGLETVRRREEIQEQNKWRRLSQIVPRLMWWF